ncbi:MAG: MFS transporter [Acidobacteria bacterium]|nr:MFS transporter [Acidobacteriota bacterium]
MAVEDKERFPALHIGVLGVITITVYGSWYYAFGVLLDPIIADTGWSEAVLTTSFAVASIVAGFGSLGGGWLLDRSGSRVVFGGAAMAGLLAFQVAASTDSVATFAMMAAVGGGAFGALGFYHITQTTAVRISSQATTKAIAVLTIWGAFASAIYIPVSAWLVQSVGWRLTLRIITLSAVVALVLGAIVVDTGVAGRPGRTRIWAELLASLRVSETRRFVIAQGLVGMGVATILVYQVPAMTAAGLTLTAASFWAGFRGFAQLGGRLPLLPIVSKLGTAGSLRLAFGAIGLGALLLAFAGNPILAAAYALLAGFGIGASSPLYGMHARDVFGATSLGTAMGLLSFVFLVFGSLGPAAAGWIATATGSRALPVALAAVATFAAIFFIRPGSAPSNS